MRLEVPEIKVSTADGGTEDTAASQNPRSDPSKVPDTSLIVSSILAWPVMDIYGDDDNQPLSSRISKFLNAIYVVLFMGDKLSKQQQAVRPTRATAQQIAAKEKIPKASMTMVDVDRYWLQDGRPWLATRLYKQFRHIFQIFIPQEHDLESITILLYWGLTHEICVSPHIGAIQA